MLASYLYGYKYNWNKSFDSNAVMTNQFVHNLKFDRLEFLIISPNKRKIDKLGDKWEKELFKKKYQFTITEDKLFDDAYEYFMLHEKDIRYSIEKTSNKISKSLEDLAGVLKEEDRSVTNGSSIAFILEYGNKKILFLGDAHPDIICENLQWLSENGYKLEFDFVKISHHGSKYNTSSKLLDIITSKRYCISTDGKDSTHPSFTMLANIVLSSSKKQEFYFNYELDKRSFFLTKESQQLHNYDIFFQNNIII